MTPPRWAGWGVVAVAKSGFIGAKAHLGRIKKLQGETMVREVGSELFACGELIETEAAISMTAGRSEVVDKKKHVPSKPGEPPAVYEGDLRRSLETVQVAPLVVEVSANDRKAAWLEFGTSKMEARPYMGPARDAKRKEITQRIRRSVDRAVRKSRSSD